MHLFHQWGRWGEPVEYRDSFSGRVLKQLRACAACNKVQARTVDYIDEPVEIDEGSLP